MLLSIHKISEMFHFSKRPMFREKEIVAYD